VFAAIDAFEYPELHDESIPALNFFRHLGKLMASTGVKDFGLKVRGAAAAWPCASPCQLLNRPSRGAPSLLPRRCRPHLLQDVYKPESVRLRRHLSAVVNFAKFREEKLVAYTEMQAHIDALLEERRVLEEENLAKVGGRGGRGRGSAGG
jgi:kinetochore protein Nuf2